MFSSEGGRITILNAKPNRREPKETRLIISTNPKFQYRDVSFDDVLI